MISKITLLWVIVVVASCTDKLSIDLKRSKTQSKVTPLVSPESSTFTSTLNVSIQLSGLLSQFKSMRYSLDGSDVDCSNGTVLLESENIISLSLKSQTLNVVACDKFDRVSAQKSYQYDFVLTANHQGWKNIRAVGSVVEYTDVTLKPTELMFSWHPMLATDELSISSYKVFRSTSSSDLGQLVAEVLSTDSLQYKDISVTSETAYFYVVKPVRNGVLFEAVGDQVQLKINVPPNNMALVHRWAANSEMCGLLRLPTDSARHNACSFDGPGSKNGQLDVGYSYFVDVNPAGCNFTPAPACSNASFGCLGNGVPSNGVGNVYDVYFDRQNTRCYVKQLDNTWGELFKGTWGAASSRSRTDIELTKMVSPKARLPILKGYFHFADAQASCNLQTIGTNRKRLLSHREYILAAAWSSDLSASELDEIHSGLNLTTTKGCDVLADGGLSYSATIDAGHPDTRYSANAGLGLRTYSLSTEKCESRYGVRDMIGSNQELSSDQLLCNDTTQQCTGIASTLVPSNTDWENLDFNAIMGPLVNAGNFYNLGWSMKTEYVAKGADRFSLPLGIPVHNSSSTVVGAIPINTSSTGFNPAQFYGSQSVATIGSWGPFLDTEPRAVNSGGPGRFTFNIRHHSGEVWVGFRCGMTVDE